LLLFKVFVAVLSFLTSFADTFPALLVRSSINRLAASGAVSLEKRGGQIQLGWVGLEPTTNALKGRCSTIELPTRQETSSESITKFLRCNRKP
jgi:hypothetical protein